jgi:hypothetical protein
MRKLLITALTAAAVLAVGGVAMAANVYTVDGGSRPAGKGSKKKPKPVAINFDFTVADEDPTLRGTPIEKFAIGAEGLVTYPEAFPTCTFAQANRPGSPDPACRKARVGGGLVQNLTGPPNSPTTKLYCNVDIDLYNISGAGRHGGLAIVVDGEEVTPPPSEEDRTGCIIDIHAAIRAVYVPVRIGGQPADELRFTVPFNLLHPSGLENTIRNTESAVRRLVARKRIGGKRRKVGFYSSVGCKGRTRLLQVTFTDEAGDAVKETDTGRC